jgi:hypothetical protein
MVWALLIALASDNVIFPITVPTDEIGALLWASLFLSGESRNPKRLQFVHCASAVLNIRVLKLRI